MPKLLTLMLTLALSLTLVACGGEDKKDGKDGDKAGAKDGAKDGDKANASDPAAQIMEKLGTVPDILGGVKDGDSAKSAAGKLTSLAEELKPMVAKADASKGLSDEMQTKLDGVKTKAKEALAKALPGLLTDPGAAQQLKDAFSKIGEVMQGFADKAE